MLLSILPLPLHPSGELAQLVERLHGMQEVSGSNPLFSTKYIFYNMFFIYIIYSIKIDQYYIGQTKNLENRLYRHNNSGSKSTKKANDWTLKYTEGFTTRSLALKRETEIKGKKSRSYIESLIRF